MATRKILVLSDGETWETFDEGYTAKVLEITEEAFKELCEGSEPHNLNDDQIIRRYDVREA